MNVTVRGLSAALRGGPGPALLAVQAQSRIRRAYPWWLPPGLLLWHASAVGLAATFTLLVLASPEPASAQTCPSSLDFGGAVACTLGATGEVGSFTFVGAAGDVVRVRAIGTSGTLVVTPEMLQPDGSVLCRASTSEMTCKLRSAGTHTIRVIGSSRTGTGLYTLYIQRLNDPVGCAGITSGTRPTPGAIDLAGDLDCFTFPAEASDVVRVRVRQTSGRLTSPSAEVAQPDGATVCEPASFGVGVDLDCSLRVSGRHTIFVGDSFPSPSPAFSTGSRPGVGRYTLFLQRLNNPVGCGSVSFGGPPVSGVIDGEGVVDCFTFSGAARDRVRAQAVSPSASPTVGLEIVQPDGATICGTTGPFAEQTCQLQVAGRHAIFVNSAIARFPFSSATSTVRYSLAIQRLNSPVGCTSLAFSGTLTSGSIEVLGEMDCFTFAAAAGDLARVWMVPTSDGLRASAEVMRPDGSAVCSTTSQTPRTGQLTCRLDVAGTHAILVRNGSSSFISPVPTPVSGSDTGRYSLYLQRVSNPVGCTALSYGDAPVSGSVDRAAETDCFTFSAGANDQVRVRLATTATLSAYLEVVRPNGSLCDSSLGPSPVGFPGATAPFGGVSRELACTFEVGGTATVLVSDFSGRGTGTYQLVVECVAGNCPPVGGRGFALSSAPVRMSWSSGTRQNGYLLTRLALPSRRSDVLPDLTAPLPAAATTYTDTATLTEPVYCYILLPLSSSGPIANSDVLCLFPNSRSTIGAPRDFTIQLNESNSATLTWASPTGTVFEGYQLRVFTFAGVTPQIVSLPQTATGSIQSVAAGPTCYQLMAVRAGIPVGKTDVLCGIPGLATVGSGGGGGPVPLRDLRLPR